jgi:glycosyltransferase involved in cell wall biosynthesis
VDARTQRQVVALIGTRARGGVAAVINAYRQAGLFSNWPVVHVQTHCDGSTLQKFALAARSLTRFVGMLIRRRVLLAHVHSASNASFWRKSWFVLAAYAARRPVVFHVHGGGFQDFYERIRHTRRGTLMRFILDRAAVIVVLSETWRRRVAQMTRNPNIEVIPSPVEATDLLRIERDDPNRQTLLFMGRLDRYKGIHLLIEALASLRVKYPAVRLCLAGEGEERERLQRMVEKHRLTDSVEFVGWVAERAKTAAWERAGIYALPSYIEGLPMTVLEAMAAGVPVVATRVGGVPELVTDGVNGILIEPGDAAALTAALDRLLGDPALRARLGSAGRECFLEHYAPNRVIPHVEALYARLGARSRRNGADTGSGQASDVATTVENEPAANRDVPASTTRSRL